MLHLSEQGRYFLFRHAVDMRKSFHGLAAVVTGNMKKDVLNGDIFIFISKRRQAIKLLQFQGDGFAIYYKLLEKGTFELPAADQEVVIAERESHPQSHVRRKMLVLWLLHCGITRAKAATIAGLGRATVQRYVAAYRDGGLEGLRQWDVTGPVSDLASFTEAIRVSLTDAPVRTAAEACDRIEQLTGLRRQPTQVRTFLKGLGFQWRRIRALPVPPKKTWPTTSESNGSSWTAN